MKKWEIEDFLYVELSSNQTKIFCDRFVAYEGAGAFMYKDGVCVAQIEEPVLDVSPCGSDGELEHYYVRTNDRTIYIMCVDKKRVHLSSDAKQVILNENDVPYKLLLASLNSPTFWNEHSAEIEEGYLWSVKECIEGIIFRIEKKGEERYVQISSCTTIASIKESANLIKEMEEEKE